MWSNITYWITKKLKKRGTTVTQPNNWLLRDEWTFTITCLTKNLFSNSNIPTKATTTTATTTKTSNKCYNLHDNLFKGTVDAFSLLKHSLLLKLLCIGSWGDVWLEVWWSRGLRGSESAWMACWMASLTWPSNASGCTRMHVEVLNLRRLLENTAWRRQRACVIRYYYCII